jgi:predicted unusual protein kinase regulating ubiquinone biosynthesis (AarF/ABC1/UbiB family)
MNKLKEILFLFRALVIIFTEFIIYAIYRDTLTFVDRLTQRLAKINILYVKVFQAFALNNKLIDEKINNMLLKFTDSAPWVFSDIDIDDLIEITDKYNLSLENGYNPINAGMISLVFKAYDRNNNDKHVIIKMKRKNIQETLNSAIENLLFLMYILSFIPVVNKYQLAEVINKNIEIIRHQTNFIEEVDNMNKMKMNCKNLKYVKIPTAQKEVTEEYPNCIIMEFIEGIKINQINEEDYEGFAKQVMKFGFVTTLIHGVTHGDLHGGNILFIKDENETKYKHKIGVIDFGIIYEIDTKYKGFLFDLLTEMFNNSPEVSAEKLLTSGMIEPVDVLKSLPNDHYKNILNFTTEIVRDTVCNSKQANQVQIYKFISQFKTYITNPEISSFGLKPSDNFVKTQLVLAMSQGVTLTLCKDDYMVLADKVINELFHTNMMI